MTMYARIGEQRKSEVAANFVLEGQGLANEGWTLCSGVLRQTCTDVEPMLF